MATNTITIDQVEQLAARLENDEAARRAKLSRLIVAYARILAMRAPGLFKARATWHADEAGHYDNSYPPKQVYSDRSGPDTIEVRDWTTDDIATSGGFYYSWRRVTTDAGLFVGRDGTIYGANETGTGRLGQFAAHPGDCDVECKIEWSECNDVSTADLGTIEQALRRLAFPLVAAAGLGGAS